MLVCTGGYLANEEKVAAEYGSLFCSPYYAVGGSCSGLSQSSGRIAAQATVDYLNEA